MEQGILSRIENGVGWIVLNRPEKLNALSVPMIDQLYALVSAWKKNSEVKLVVIEGAGEKAFSAGGDVRHLYDQKKSEVHEVAASFFGTEYKMNMVLHTFGKPVVTLASGIVLGGGVGIAVTGTHRIVTESTKWAMPEMNIGLYPDVGGSYFLNKMPHALGRYLALTSSMIKAADVLYAGAADYYMPSAKLEALRKEIASEVWTDGCAEKLEMIIGKYEEVCPETASFEALCGTIEEHFKHDSLEAIVEALSISASAGDAWAGSVKALILEKSPTSLKVTLEQLVRGAGLPLKDCFVMELNMSMNFMDSHDFFEGVRSVLVEKDKHPNWKPASLDAVTRDQVEAFFTYAWERVHPLSDFEI